MSVEPSIGKAEATTNVSRALNVMIVGVGGQGVLMISKALALIGQKQGLAVKQSEVHGMAKRGGVVFSHVRFGEEVWSPTIARGEADALIALEWAEGLRWLEYLRPETGVFIADTRRIVPPFACRSRRHGAAMAYARETPAEVLDKVIETVRGRMELRRLVRTLTAQGRFSRWVLTALPVCLALLLTLISPGYMRPLLHTLIGQVLLFLTAIMVALGSWVIGKIVDIRI